MAVDLNLPPEITDAELTELWDAFHRACAGIGLAVVTGHTARYDGCTWPMVGGAVCMASGPEDQFVTPAMARGRRRGGDEGRRDRGDRAVRRDLRPAREETSGTTS